jgi:hypothetical protein
MWQLLLLAFLLCIIVLAVMGSIIGFVFGVIVTLLMRIDGKKSKGTKKKELSDTEKASQDDVVKQPSSSANEEHDAMCYVCHGTGADESGQPLRRDCACRGTDAGFFHLACLTGFAASKSVRWDGGNEFVKPWKTCLSCHHDYQNELAVDIATEFLSFVRGKYPHDEGKQLESLYLKLCALDYMIELQPVQKREAGVTANELLSLVDRMKRDASPLPRRYSQFEANTLGVHGRIALDEGSEESARRAVVHFENQLEVYKAIGDAHGIAIAKSNVAYAKSKYKGGTNGELMKATREFYELRVAEFGDEHYYTIDAGIIYALRLQEAYRREEARELLTKLLTTSKRVLGPHHNITKDVTYALKQVVNDEDGGDDNVDDISSNNDDNDDDNDDGWEENAQ